VFCQKELLVAKVVVAVSYLIVDANPRVPVGVDITTKLELRGGITPIGAPRLGSASLRDKN
jgi:hypothetical protein